jgi:hypothetical protein
LDAAVTAVLPAVLSAMLAAVVAIAGYAGGWIVTGAACLVALALAIGWPDLLVLPSRAGTSLLVGALGVAGAVAAMLAVGRDTVVERPLAVFAGVIAVALLTAFAHELVRRDGRVDVVESVTGTLTGQVIAVLAAGWVLLSFTSAGAGGVVVGATAVAVSRLVASLPLPVPEQMTAWIGGAFGVVGAVTASFLVEDVEPTSAVVAGVAVSAVAVAVDRVFGPPPTRFDIAVLSRAAAPVAAAGTVAYAVARLNLG